MRYRISTAAIVVMLGATVAVDAQSWRGMGRVAGKVVDESGQAIEGATVSGFLAAANGGTNARTNSKGEWVLGAIARGDWQLEIAKDGFETRTVTVTVNELSRLPPMTITLKKAAAAADPNAELKSSLERAAALMNDKQFAAARAVYEGLLARHPQAHQLYPLIARTYYGENAIGKAVEFLEIALEKQPSNPAVRLLLGNLLIEKGDVDAGRSMLASVADADVKDPTVFLNVGIALINSNKAEEALIYFQKNIALFPGSPDAYYYRGITHLQLGKTPEARADLEKFVTMAPDAPEAPMAKKILEQLK